MDQVHSQHRHPWAPQGPHPCPAIDSATQEHQWKRWKIWIYLFFFFSKKYYVVNPSLCQLSVRNYQDNFSPTNLFYWRNANWFNLALLNFFQRLLPNNSRDTRPPSPPTLDLIVTRYLREQHAQCTNPVSAGPPFSLIRLVATHLVWFPL